MLNVIRATQLKEGGFPQKWTDGRYFYLHDQPTAILFERIKDGMDERGNIIDYRETLTAIPTLDELISACGDKFGGLDRKSDGKWWAWSIANADLEPRNTPEETVADLYLDIQSKLNESG